jgi:lambda repressor-like predicted transcriptional regulator
MAGWKEWTTPEARVVYEMWPNGASLEQIAAKLPGRSVGAIAEFRDKHHIKRKPGCFTLPHQDAARNRIIAALRTSSGLTMKEIMQKAPVTKATAVAAIADMHGKGLYVARWLRTTRKPAAIWLLGNEPDAPYPVVPVAQRIGKRKESQLRLAVNPFAVSAGLVSAPTCGSGRIIKHLHDDEMEAA